jgi:uncharacterized damage-inducible protein DinB
MLKLGTVFEGWEGYQTSIQHAVEPLTAEQLRWRPVSGVRSLGELVRHLGLGRITWLSRIDAPGVEEVSKKLAHWYTDANGARHVMEDQIQPDNCEQLTKWLALSWEPIRRILDEWTIEHLSQTYLHKLRGTQYIVSNQWTLWRIMSHDVHHGGQIAMMLACQDIPAFELRALGGHIVDPSVAPSTR